MKRCNRCTEPLDFVKMVKMGMTQGLGYQCPFCGKGDLGLTQKDTDKIDAIKKRLGKT